VTTPLTAVASKHGYMDCPKCGRGLQFHIELPDGTLATECICSGRFPIVILQEKPDEHIYPVPIGWQPEEGIAT
jgi:hypothetical protein